MLSKLRKHLLSKSKVPKEPVSVYYDTLCHRYQDPVKAVGWLSEHTQRLRFQVLSLLDDFSDQSVLDLGCGLGGFYHYLKSESIDCDYCGVDLSRKMIDRARLLHEGGRFEHADAWSLDMSADFVVASGLLSYKMSNPMAFLDDAISLMFSLARKGLAFNLLSSYSKDSDKVSRFMYFSPEQVLKRCMAYTPNVSLHHHYLGDRDFTIYMYKDI